MLRKIKIRSITAAGLLVVPMIVAGCSGFSSQSMEIDPPPAQVEADMLQSINDSLPQAKSEQLSPTSLVFLTEQHGLLAPVSLGLPPMDNKDNLPLRQSLEAMVKNGPYAAYLPQGFTGVLPEGTEVKMISVDKEQKLAVVEFNESFTAYDASNERKILEAVTWTLTSHDNIKQVQFWVEGKKITEMPINRTPLDKPLSRSMGINLEKGEGATYTRSSSVTVYFSSTSPTGIQYYVPVTRLVETGQDPLHSAINELIRGPQAKVGLTQVMTTETSLQSVKSESSGTITVALKDDMFIKGEKVPSEFLQAIVLTVTENVGDKKVIIQLNGDTNVIGYDNKNYGEPVSRSQYINEIPI
ncbi:GerMN domain-containing protein [Paenibacillus crassostreae]|uniref:GerMN domain-containing protein n=1 Tax=Paenibacillus crassostreae TaxID=1763538 RepID=A0A167EDG1_9BACL|nr:GerMN domain-containing protein [Paenibacillus crassostreae]AOZ91945.1 hypothetical protein LPB68_06745 [Paenibacillus crassostreae]OAB75424.1 hypothetical protein PNBC_08650 [Paenibacillus crassostreae]